MKSLFIFMALIFSSSAFSNCFEHIDRKNVVINIISTGNYSKCSDNEILFAKDRLSNFLDERIHRMKREFRKSEKEEVHLEQFRLITEINSAKTSLMMLDREFKSREQ